MVGITKPYKVWKFVRDQTSGIPAPGRTGKGNQDPSSLQPASLQSNKEVIPGSQTNPVSPSVALLPKLPEESRTNLLESADDESFSDSVIIMAFLTIPILLLVGVGAIIRLRSNGKDINNIILLLRYTFAMMKLIILFNSTLGCCNRRKESKSFAEFFPPSAGFEKLRMDESDNENSDTEIEEFTLPSYRKSLKT